MSVKSKRKTRFPPRRAQTNSYDARAQRNTAKLADAAKVLAALKQISAIDEWESKRVDEARIQIHAEANERRVDRCAPAHAASRRLRDRGETLASVATLIGVDLHRIRALLTFASANVYGGTTKPKAPASALKSGDGTLRLVASAGDGARRCVRCAAPMLDSKGGPQRGRRRLYCTDTCRRDASAARTAAERFGSPIRVVEVPRAGSCLEHSAENAPQESSTAITPLDAVDMTLQNHKALHALLSRVTEQARLKKLDRATLTAARELAKAVRPQRA